MFLRCGPNSVCGSLHVILPKARFSGTLFTLAPGAPLTLALATTRSDKKARRQQNPPGRPIIPSEPIRNENKYLIYNNLSAQHHTRRNFGFFANNPPIAEGGTTHVFRGC